MAWLSPCISILGAFLALWGAMALAFRGVFGAKINLLHLSFRLLLGLPYIGPEFDREPSLTYGGLTPDETKGWRLIAWGFILQGAAAIVGVVFA